MMCGNQKIRLIVADDSSLLRRALQKSLTKMGFTVIGEACNGRDAVNLVEQTTPDLLILDIEMPEMDGVSVTRRLRQTHSPVKILILSNYTDKVFVGELIRLGVNGYMVKEDAPFKLSEAICAITVENRTWFSPKVSM